MTVTVNGEARPLAPGTTVAALVELLGLGRLPCAVEVNKTLVRKARHGEQTLAEGDTVEIVTLVGGG